MKTSKIFRPKNHLSLPIPTYECNQINEACRWEDPEGTYWILRNRLTSYILSICRTIPLRPDDYQRFKPEYWLQNHNPNPVAFTDLAVLQSELELRRRRELHRQNSHRMHADGQENNFNSLPWEEIIPRRISGTVTEILTFWKKY